MCAGNITRVVRIIDTVDRRSRLDTEEVAVQFGDELHIVRWKLDAEFDKDYQNS